jgi:hypothetical protein
MNDKTADTTPTATEAGFTLWHRTGRRAKGRRSPRPRPSASWAAIERSGRRHGDWLVLPSGSKP